MIRFKFLLGLLLGIALVLIAATPPAAHAAGPQALAQTRTPIKHFVTLMQENHSFDNYFGTYPGAEGIPANTCVPVDPAAGPGSQCIKPFHLGDKPIVDLDHSADTSALQFNEGKMDGFIQALYQKGQDGTLAMGYYDDRDIPYYWNLADNYVLFDRFFSSASDGSYQNHVYWVAAAPLHKQTDSNHSLDDVTTIFDRLQAKGVSWKFYVESYDPTVNYRNQSLVEQTNPNRLSQLIWVPLLNLDRFLDNPNLSSHIVDLEQFYLDAQNGTLPEVSYIVPAGASEHPPGAISSGVKFVRGVIQELQRSSAWPTTAFMLSYDDWGGWYDHVPPPIVDDYGYGFRVPTILVSPYAKQGFVDHTVYDYTSMLKFIEYNWDLQPLATRDAQANNILDAFDFTQPPRPPLFLSSVRNTPVPTKPPVQFIYAAYGAAILVGLAFVMRVSWMRRRKAAGQAMEDVR